MQTFVRSVLRRWIRGALFIGLTSLSLAAAPILTVGGPTNYAQSISEQALAVAFTTTQTFSNVVISAPEIACVNCQGIFFLYKNKIGPSASIGDTLDGGAFNASSPVVLNEASLPAGTYFVILAITQGTGVWGGSLMPTVTAASGITEEIDFRADTLDTGFPPQSDFGVILGFSRLHYNITATAATPVPEPSVVSLCVAGLFALVGLGQRSRQRHALPARDRRSRV